MYLLNKLEGWVNWLSDKDWGWWPVVSLRPPKDKRIDSLLTFKLTLIFGPLAGLVTVAFLIWAEGPLSFLEAFFIMNACFVVYFLFVRFITAYFWNKRAKRLTIGFDERAAR